MKTDMTTKKALFSSLSLILFAQAFLTSALAAESTTKEFTLVPRLATEVFRGSDGSETRVTIQNPDPTVQCSIKTADNETTPLVQNTALVSENDTQVVCTLANEADHSTRVQVMYTVTREARSDLPEMDSIKNLRGKLTNPLFQTQDLVKEVTPKFPNAIKEITTQMNAENPEFIIHEKAPENQLFVIEYQSAALEGFKLVCDSRTEKGDPEVFAKGYFGYKAYLTRAPSTKLSCALQPELLTSAGKQKKKNKKSTDASITLKVSWLNIPQALALLNAQESEVTEQAAQNARNQEKAEIAALSEASDSLIAANEKRIRLHVLEEKLQEREQQLAEKNRELEALAQTHQNTKDQNEQVAHLALILPKPQTALSKNDRNLILIHHQTEAQKARKRVDALALVAQKSRESFAKETSYTGLGYAPEREMNGFALAKDHLKTRLIKRHYVIEYRPYEFVLDGHQAVKTSLQITGVSQTLADAKTQFTQKITLPAADSTIGTSSNWPENGSLSKEKIEFDTCWDEEANFKSIFADLKKQRSVENLRPSVEEAVERILASTRYAGKSKKTDPECKEPSPTDIIDTDLVRGPVTLFCYLAETREKNYDGFDRRNEIVLLPHRIKTEYMVYGSERVLYSHYVNADKTRSYDEVFDSIKGVWTHVYASTLGESKNKEIHPFFKTTLITGLEHHEGLNTQGEICVPSLTAFPKYEKNGGVYGALDAYLAHAYGQ